MNIHRACPHLSQHDYHLNPWSVLVTKDVLHERGARISGKEEKNITQKNVCVVKIKSS